VDIEGLITDPNGP